MIRLTNNQGRSLFAVLWALRQEIPADAPHAVAVQVQHGNVPRDDYDLMVDPDRGDVPDMNAEEIINQIRKQLQSNSEKPEEIIDKVAAILMRPLHGNMLNSGAVHQLRDAILSPDERNKLVKDLEKTLRCQKCGHAFLTDGEFCQVYNDGYQVALRCSNCLVDTYVACATRGCNHSVQFNGVLKSIQGAPKCKECKEGQKVAAEPEDEVAAQAREAAELINRMRRPRVAPGARLFHNDGMARAQMIQEAQEANRVVWQALDEVVLGDDLP